MSVAHLDSSSLAGRGNEARVPSPSPVGGEEGPPSLAMRSVPFPGWGEEGTPLPPPPCPASLVVGEGNTSGQLLLLLMLTLQTGQEGPLIPNVAWEEEEEEQEEAPHTMGGPCFTSTANQNGSIKTLCSHP